MAYNLYGYFGSNLTDLQAAATEAERTEAALKAAREQGFTERMNALARLSGERQRTRADADEAARRNQTALAELAQTGKLGERGLDIRANELEEARKTREAQEIERIRQQEETNRIARERIASAEKIAGMRIPEEDPRFTLDRIRQQREEQESNAFSEAGARAANQKLQSIIAQYRTKRAAEVDSGFFGRARKTNEATRNAEADQWLAEQISDIQLQMLSSGANLRFNPETQAFEPVLRGGGVGAFGGGAVEAPAMFGPSPEPALPAPQTGVGTPFVSPDDPLGIAGRRQPRTVTQGPEPSAPSAPFAPSAMPSRASILPEGYRVFIDDADFDRRIAALPPAQQEEIKRRARDAFAAVVGVADVAIGDPGRGTPTDGFTMMGRDLIGRPLGAMFRTPSGARLGYDPTRQAQVGRMMQNPSTGVLGAFESLDPETKDRIYRMALGLPPRQPYPAMFE
jgi:hypothetical protein